jgi:hypothetical protein
MSASNNLKQPVVFVSTTCIIISLNVCIKGAHPQVLLDCGAIHAMMFIIKTCDNETARLDHGF